MPDSSRLILITGITRGLGRAMARDLAERGHRIAGCGRDPETVAELRSELGAPHDIDAVDVSSQEAVAEWAARVLASVGVPALVINNAAVINRSAPLWQISAAEFEQVMAFVKGDLVVTMYLPPVGALVPVRGPVVMINLFSFPNASQLGSTSLSM